MTKTEFMSQLGPGQPEFMKAVETVVDGVWDFYQENPRFVKANILNRLLEPEAVHQFKVTWVNDRNEVEVNRGFRVQFNSALGPFRGGLRFHPSVNLGILKNLALDQTIKNSLSSLPMGGARGGADFSPRGRSEAEIMRFCQAFMTELIKVIGPDVDIPSGDVGVGSREIGYLFGQYRKLTGQFNAAITGKSLDWGGTLLRPEAIGFGVAYFANEMLKTRGESLKDKTVAISGFGNVAWGAIKKLNQLGAVVITLSGPDGFIIDADGIAGEKLDYLLELRASGNERISDYARKYPSAKFFLDKKPWGVRCDLAIPCATQHEIGIKEAQELKANGCGYVIEGGHAPCTAEALAFFLEQGVLVGPGKAANLGSIVVGGLELTQNSQRLRWTYEEVDRKLMEIVGDIHHMCLEYAKNSEGLIDYSLGANIAAFNRIANAMIDQGLG